MRVESRQRSSRTPFAEIRVTVLILYSLIMSPFGLIASPERPYIHELFGPEFRLSWPEGQKLHEEVMELYYAGDYISAAQKLDKAIADAEHFSKTKEKDTAILLTTKAAGVARMGDVRQADALFLKAQDLAERVLATNHPVTAHIQSARIEVLLMRGNWREAKILLEQAPPGQDGQGGERMVLYAIQLRLKAIMHLAEGDPAQASDLMNQSSQIIEKVMGPQSNPYGVNQWLQSQTDAARGEYDKAMRRCELSLRILTNSYAPEHLILVSGRNTLADIYQQLGMYEPALQMLKENLQTLERTVGNDSVPVSTTLNSLGLLHYRLGNYSDAEGLLRRCVSIREKHLGVDSSGYAGTLNNLALVLMAMGKNTDVSTLFKDAVSALDKSVGKDSPELATVLLNWGIYSRSLGQTDIAKRAFTEAFAILDKAFGKDHPSVAAAAEEYAQLQCDLGDFKHALHLVSLAFSIKTNFFGPDHPARADSLGIAARIFAGMGDDRKAAELYARSAEIHAKVFGAEHPAVGYDLESAALALCRTGDLEKAAGMLFTALRLQRGYLAGQLTKASTKDAFSLTSAALYRTGLAQSLCALSGSNAAPSALAQAAEQLAYSKAILEEVQATQVSLEFDSGVSTRELCAKLDAVRNALARLSESNLQLLERDATRRRFQSVMTQTEEALAASNELVAQTMRERNLTLTDIALCLPPQTVLVDFNLYRRYDFASKTNRWKEQHYVAYLTFPLTLDSTNVAVERVDLGQATPINEAVDVAFTHMSAGQFAAKALSLAMQRLSDLVYAPLARHLTNVSHLIILSLIHI